MIKYYREEVSGVKRVDLFPFSLLMIEIPPLPHPVLCGVYVFSPSVHSQSNVVSYLQITYSVCAP